MDKRLGSSEARLGNFTAIYKGMIPGYSSALNSISANVHKLQGSSQRLAYSGCVRCNVETGWIAAI